MKRIQIRRRKINKKVFTDILEIGQDQTATKTSLGILLEQERVKIARIENNSFKGFLFKNYRKKLVNIRNEIVGDCRLDFRNHIENMTKKKELRR